MRALVLSNRNNQDVSAARDKHVHVQTDKKAHVLGVDILVGAGERSKVSSWVSCTIKFVRRLRGIFAKMDLCLG